MANQYRVKIEKIVPQTKNSSAYLLVPLNKDDGFFDYNVGQFYMLQAEIDRENKEGKNVRETDKRAYSIVSHPLSNDYIELLVQKDFLKANWEKKSIEERRSLKPPFAEYFMEQYKEGDECLLIGPNGRFLKHTLDNNEECMAYWYAGSGIPSGLSLCEYVLAKGLKKKILLFGSNKRLEDIVYHDRILKDINSSEGLLQFICTLTGESVDIPTSQLGKIIYRKGRFFSNNENSLQKYIGSDWSRYYHAICGSSSFINGTTRSRKDNRIIKGICKNDSCKKEFASVHDKSGNLIGTCDNCGGEIEIFKGIKDRLVEIGVEEKVIETDQFYLH